MTRPPNMTPDKPDTKPSHDELAEQMADWEKKNGPVELSPIIKHTVESLRATYQTLSTGNSPGRPRKDKR